MFLTPFLMLLTGCAGESPLVGETLTADGTWRLALSETTYDQGRVPLDLTATVAADGGSAEGLTIFAQPDMETMAHPMAVTDFGEAGEGRYEAELLLDMSGLWRVSGYAGDADNRESFTFIIEVSP